MSNKTKAEISNDLLSKAAELEGNLLNAKGFAGEYADDVELILERVRTMTEGIRDAIDRAASPDNSPGASG
jgi:hypothetical protein